MNQKVTEEIKAVLFDVDNTLLASNQFVFEHIKATVNGLQKEGVRISMPSDDTIRKTLAKNLAFEAIFNELFPEGEKNQSHAETVLTRYRSNANTKIFQPTPFALEAVQTLKKAGIKIGLVTNRVRMLDSRLGQAGFDINDFFCISTPGKKEWAKPHPRAFEEAVIKLQATGIHTDQILVIGDHPDDYYSAAYQGLRFVAILQGGTNRNEFQRLGLEDTLIGENLNNIEDILEKAVLVWAYRASLSRSSALDGRHFAITYPLRHFFSEYALHKYRVKTEIEHIITLSEFFSGRVIRNLQPNEKEILRDLYKNFSWHDAYEILQYDHLGRKEIGPTEHDVKSCELWIREKLENTGCSDLIPAVHLFVTSEDINNVAYKMMLSEAVNNILVPSIHDIADQLKNLAEKHANDPLMARTHLQPASPTTFGKIFATYVSRLTDGLEELYYGVLKGKINGAVGNYNAFIAVYPELDWRGYSQELCQRLNFECELWTDQRGPHIDMIQTFQIIQEIGNIVRDIATDLCLYAGFGTMYFSKIESHVGSSVMPHKINPWFAEVAEGNIKKANSIINGFSNELDVSRLQRDLSDHDFERSYGEAFGYVLIAIEHLKIALNLIRPDTEAAKIELENHPEIVSEALQTILRKHGRSDSYDRLKNAFRGKKLQKGDLEKFIADLPVDQNIKTELMNSSDPKKYTGMAGTLALDAVTKYNLYRKRIKEGYFLKKKDTSLK